MKTRILFLLICSLLSLSAVGQGTITRQKCTTYGKVMVQCPYKGKHPKPKPAPKASKPTTPEVKYCDICGNPLSQCDYGGKHPYCQTCGKLKERCEYKGEHPVCEICGKLKEKCEYNGEHPVCETCGKVKEQCAYNGKHPVCETCGKVKEQCAYNGKHPVCQTCGKVKEKCKYKGEHPVCQTCGKVKEKCAYNGKHPVCETCGRVKEKCAYNGKHPVCETCGKVKEKCEFRGEHPTEKTFSAGNVSFTVILVNGGTFTMGATSDSQTPNDDEKPTHRVTLSSYYIGQYEVTQALWKAVMGSNPSKRKGNNLPVENVSWDDCQNFLLKLNAMTGQNFRLPTEAEWEYAARGGNRSRNYQYSGSNNLGNVAWYNDNSGKQTHIVGIKLPNELGINDMSGNVWEWCQDWKENYSSSAQTNPTGPESGSCHVIRGGSWSFSAESCRVSYRHSLTPDAHSGILGLRLALSL